MKQIIGRIKDFYMQYKKEKWFRYLAVISILVIIASIVSAVDDFRHKDAKPPDNGEQSIVLDIIEDSSVHLFLICVISGGLVYAKHADELKLKEKK